ncbi:hypothetical protein QC761_0062660 [Podospora bellae-mahoneyi]|uniref:Uncharacterized protein n=1 Tax=Podospora bellae-mahoneyi TaxID=2093777 RepID=A0ABR0FG51_9PEZI|nr:hypothetical protein QC761_0062660 [Podospora bellae-mahoneyi]
MCQLMMEIASLSAHHQSLEFPSPTQRGHEVFWMMYRAFCYCVVANFLLLLTCVSPNVKDLALYRVNVTRLAKDLHSQVLDKTEDTSPKDLLHPNLQLIGFCRRRFLPTQDILTLVEHSLTSGTDDGTQDETISKLLTTWNSTLTQLDSPEQHDRAAKFAAMTKAGVTIIIVVIILDILLLGPSLWWSSSKKRLPRVFYLISAVYGMIAMGRGLWWRSRCLMVFTWRSSQKKLW